MVFNARFECNDRTDEGHYLPAYDTDESIKTSFTILNIYPSGFDHFCGWGWFSCGNGQCSISLWTKPICYNGRDVQYVRKILQQSSAETETVTCWTFAICRLGFSQFFAEFDVQTCTSVTCNQIEYLFPTKNPIAYPSVFVIYYTNRSFEYSVTPDYICYDAFVCRDIYRPTIIKLNRTCNKWKEIMNDWRYTKDNWTTLVSNIRQSFIPCILPKPENVNNVLFDCGPILISKHRLHDKYVDCANNKDELDSHDTCSLGVAQRFQCPNGPTQCILRTQLFDQVKDCSDGIDETDYYHCVTALDSDCRRRRGTLEHLKMIKFTQLCDGFVDVQFNNKTDESECPLIWKKACNTTRKNCDFYWHCQNGQDEIGCKYNNYILKGIVLECNNKQQFYCTNRTTKQLVCYSNDMAGDGHEDCIGGIDERVGGFCHSK